VAGVRCNAGLRDGEPKLTEDAHDQRIAVPSRPFDMLVAMDEVARPCPFDVLPKVVKTLMHAGIDFVDPARGIVGDEHVDRREFSQELAHLPLLPEVVSSRLVAPATAEPAETQPSVLMDSHMKIIDPERERRIGIMISSDGERVVTPIQPGRPLNGLIMEVAAREQEIGLGAISLPHLRVIVSDCHDSQHCGLTTRVSGPVPPRQRA
jgi:hypothetical protein